MALRNFSLRSALALALATSATFAANVQTAEAEVPIDCTILLCLAGGWPSVPECTAAKAEFIRRITPWPVEPPLQIWRCPMGAALPLGLESQTASGIWDVLHDGASSERREVPSQGHDGGNLPMPAPAVLSVSRGGSAALLPEGFTLRLVQDGEFVDGTGESDVDISGYEFDFVRSIRVFMIRVQQWEVGREGEKECRRTASVRLGSYGVQGDYRWEYSNVGRVPPAFLGLGGYGEDCPPVGARAVFVDWRDHQGIYGWERVDY